MKLKPCPLCGSQPKVCWDLADWEPRWDPPYYAKCYNITCCYIYISQLDQDDAERAWNKRICQT